MGKAIAAALQPLIFVVAVCGQLAVPSSRIPPADRDAFVGTWKANREQSVPRLSKEEGLYTRTFTRMDNYLLSSSAQGRRKWHNEYLCDGAFHPTAGSPDGAPQQDVACSYLSTAQIIGESRISGTTSYWSWEVTSNRSQYLARFYSNKDRTVVKSTRVMDRVE